jgi:hypothetical protein
MSVRVVLAVLVLAAVPLHGNDRLAMRVSPSVAYAPANLLVRASVEADAQNRALQIIAESPEFYRSSEIQLDGDRAPRTSMFEFRGLPGGMYRVRAVLKGAGGRALATTHAAVQIVDAEPRPVR